jgi:general secretion pathway protein J
MSRPRPSASRRRARGFTLIELLVAITLLGLLATLLFGGLRLGVRAWEMGGKVVDEHARLISVHGFLRQRLSDARPVNARLDDPDQADAIAFHGGSDALEFVTVLPPDLAPGGLYAFAIGTTDTPDDPGRSDLVVRWSLFEPVAEAAGEAPESTETLLLESIAGATFSYFGRPRPDADPDWLETWPREDVLPALIRIAVAFADGDRRAWPELIVAPAAAE